MDIYKKELTEIYTRQNLGEEHLDYEQLPALLRQVGSVAQLTGMCCVVTDIARDESWFIPGASLPLLELPIEEQQPRLVASSDEDFLYTKIHQEDLVDLRMLEYEFFKTIDPMPREQKMQKTALAEIRFGKSLVPISKSTRVLALSPKGRIWLMLCGYLPLDHEQQSCNPRIADHVDGTIQSFSFSNARGELLTPREKQILSLIREGLLSKEIAELLHLSHNTVNRHRQNILMKLSVGNSMEAVKAAVAMRLL